MAGDQPSSPSSYCSSPLHRCCQRAQLWPPPHRHCQRARLWSMDASTALHHWSDCMHSRHSSVSSPCLQPQRPTLFAGRCSSTGVRRGRWHGRGEGEMAWPPAGEGGFGCWQGRQEWPSNAKGRGERRGCVTASMLSSRLVDPSCHGTEQATSRD